MFLTRNHIKKWFMDEKTLRKIHTKNIFIKSPFNDNEKDARILAVQLR